VTVQLPSLGFIGTVIGMGEALLQADSLFGSADRQRTIGLMTEQLGYAFDTTLVALLCGLLVSTALAVVRRNDQAFVSWFEADMAGQFLNASHGRPRVEAGEARR
jgi:biopolymer transport protein ExbB/TolQ